MSSAASPVKPIFGDEETNYIKPVAGGPFSKLAAAALGMGILSLTAAYSPAMLLLPMLAIALGAAALWQTTRDEGLRGRTTAAIGLGLGLMFCAWSLTAAKMRDNRLFDSGAEFAGHVLKLIAEDKRYEVYELTLPEGQRQTANVSLKDHYESLHGEQRDMFEGFFRDAGTREVLGRGSKADWRYTGGVKIINLSEYETEVVVSMEDASRQPVKQINVRLTRFVMPEFEGAKRTASWSLAGIRS